jgi:hypothetical protein
VIAVKVLESLTRAGVPLEARNGRAHLATTRQPSPRLLQAFKLARAHLLLVADGTWQEELAGWPVSMREAFHGRLAVREGEGQPRELAEQLAFLEVREAAYAVAMGQPPLQP